jgi:hypothetical protein
MRLTTFRTLTWQDWQLFLQAYLALLGGRIRLGTQNFARLQAWSTRRAEGDASVGHLLWAVNAASRRMPAALCLPRALALQKMLAQNGHESQLKIGVAKSGDLLEAHAWLLWNGRIIMGGESAAGYVPLAGSLNPSDGESLDGAAP